MSNTFEFDRTDGFAISEVEARAAFITKTYLHVFGSIVAFIALEAILISAGAGEAFAAMLFGTSPFVGALILMGIMIGGTFLASALANSRSLSMQYAGLGLYTLVETIFFLPILTVCTKYIPQGPEMIAVAGGITFALTAAMTMIVFITRKDFSFLGSALRLAMVAALLFIFVMIGAQFFGVQMPSIVFIGFAFLMVVFMCGYILYDTSNILHHYGEDQYVAAALALFASIMTMFWYVLRIVMYFYMSSDD